MASIDTNNEEIRNLIADLEQLGLDEDPVSYEGAFGNDREAGRKYWEWMLQNDICSTVDILDLIIINRDFADRAQEILNRIYKLIPEAGSYRREA